MDGLRTSAIVCFSFLVFSMSSCNQKNDSRRFIWGISSGISEGDLASLWSGSVYDKDRISRVNNGRYSDELFLDGNDYTKWVRGFTDLTEDQKRRYMLLYSEKSFLGEPALVRFVFIKSTLIGMNITADWLSSNYEEKCSAIKQELNPSVAELSQYSSSELDNEILALTTLSKNKHFLKNLAFRDKQGHVTLDCLNYTLGKDGLTYVRADISFYDFDLANSLIEGN
jgi:hypothetical protein